MSRDAYVPYDFALFVGTLAAGGESLEDTFFWDLIINLDHSYHETQNNLRRVYFARKKQQEAELKQLPLRTKPYISCFHTNGVRFKSDGFRDPLVAVPILEVRQALQLDIDSTVRFVTSLEDPSDDKGSRSDLAALRKALKYIDAFLSEEEDPTDLCCFFYKVPHWTKYVKASEYPVEPDQAKRI